MKRPTWARRVQQHKIRLLYQSDARGILDEELIDDVGYSMFSRCESILTITLAMKGQVRCPECDEMIQRNGGPDELLDCTGCEWQLPWEEYHRSFRKKQLVGGLAIPAFEEFVTRWPARSPRDKMLQIDRLIHALHANEKSTIAFRTAGVNVIGGSLRDVKTLLNELAYSDLSTPGIRETGDSWKQSMTESEKVLAERMAKRRGLAPRTRPASRR